MRNIDLALKVIRWAFAATVALNACALTACYPSEAVPVPPPAPTASTQAHASVEQTCAVLKNAGCREGKPGPEVTRKDGTIRHGVTCVKLLGMVLEDGIATQDFLDCVYYSHGYSDLQKCGVCR